MQELDSSVANVVPDCVCSLLDHSSRGKLVNKRGDDLTVRVTIHYKGSWLGATTARAGYIQIYLVITKNRKTYCVLKQARVNTIKQVQKGQSELQIHQPSG